ncbi:Notchless protein homolog 1 [Geodia barretti]|nr:Notchless protein homolog 1 [Geodia barretti]
MEAGEDEKRVLAQFKSEDGVLVGTPFDLPLGVTKDSLAALCTAVLENDDETVYEFYVHELEVRESLAEVLERGSGGTERLVEIVYQPQARFRVQSITHCTSSIPGHSEAVIAVQFSPDGRSLASGSGDTTVRLWDIFTETPLHTCKAHKHWILCIAWSPDGKRLASGCKNGQVCVWEAETGRQVGHTLSGHKQWITSLAWQPLHLDPSCRLLASASKDATVRIWDVVLCKAVMVLSGHTQSVTGIKWVGRDSSTRLHKIGPSKCGGQKMDVCLSQSPSHGHCPNTWLSSTTTTLSEQLPIDPADPARHHTESQKMGHFELQRRPLFDTSRLSRAVRG